MSKILVEDFADPKELCIKIVSILSSDEYSEKLETSGSLEGELFDLAMRYLDESSSEEEKRRGFERIKELISDLEA